MKYLYPVSHQIPRLSGAALTIKIARHSGCSICYHDPGLRPPPGVEVVPDDVQEESSLGDLTQYGSDDDDPPAYLDLCVCGHSAREHGADQSELGRDEFARRGHVAVRLDELLQDVGMLLDFDYVDDDINSLRKQMKLPVASVSLVVESLPTPKHFYAQNFDDLLMTDAGSMPSRPAPVRKPPPEDSSAGTTTGVSAPANPRTNTSAKRHAHRIMKDGKVYGAPDHTAVDVTEWTEEYEQSGCRCIIQ